MPSIFYPLDPALVTEWPGPRDGGSWWHYGTDFGVPVNTALKACFDGEIVFAGGDGAHGVMNGVRANGEGLTVDIRRDDGLIARYGHMNRIDVRVGQRVKAGGYIGLSGNTGFTTGPHCHWELRWDRVWSGGAWVDPRTLSPKTFGAPSKPAAKPEPPITSPEEDDDMKNSGFYYEKDGGKTVINVIANTVSGFYSEYSAGTGKGALSGAYNNPLAATLGTGSFAKITESHAAEIKRACAEVRAARRA